MTKQGTRSAMTSEHKTQLALGRKEGRVVAAYLQGLRSTKGKPGRKRTPETIASRLTAIESELQVASPVKELELVQERMNLARELQTMVTVDMPALVAAFTEVAFPYSARKGYSYRAWREVGVPAAVLKKAGIPRSL